MNREKEIINHILEILPKSNLHSNSFFESDAEVLSLNGKQFLFTIDEFSQEDFFRDDRAFQLGWNVACSTISDILASGGRPTLYAHSMMFNPDHWNDKYIKDFSKGVAEVLKTSNSGFIGGDTGYSDSWRYTGVAIGETDKPISRIGAERGHLIYMTGKVGAGNLEAALKLYSDHKILSKLTASFRLNLPLRIKESELISYYASCCIDSSDGLLAALSTIADLNEVGFYIENLPYLMEGEWACKLTSKPLSMLFMGECGEYELVFTLSEENEKPFLAKAHDSNLSFTKIGRITENAIKELHTKKSEIDFCDYNIRARDFSEINDYLEELKHYAKRNEK